MNSITHSFATSTRPASRAVATVLRLGLGAVWLVAGLLKVGDPQGMVRSVRAFRILPEALVHPVAYGVPFLEIALGVLLVVGLAVRLSAAVSVLMFAAYVSAIASASARGLRIDCGCFSSGGDLGAGAPTHYTSELVRDSLLLAVAALLVWRPKGYLAVDRLLDPPDDDRFGTGANDLDDHDFDDDHNDDHNDHDDDNLDGAPASAPEVVADGPVDTSGMAPAAGAAAKAVGNG